ncbi:MAG: two-component system response regulator [Chloroflexota bacterium]|nr:MAG: two-component system response regulator [Chloroflexota bacterium]
MPQRPVAVLNPEDGRMLPSLHGRRILIVDDDPDIASAIEAALRESGATLTVATDGEQAVVLAQSGAPDLIILDAMLPKRSGFLVLEKLKPGKRKEDKPHIIMITANVGKRHQDWAMGLGAAAYINKPFRMEKLLSAVSKLLVDADAPPPA